MHPKCKYGIFIFGLFLSPFFLFAQNLVPNPSFETYISCPSGFGPPGTMVCPPWFNPNQTSTDYYNICATNPQFDVPTNFQGGQPPVTGDAYVGFWLKSGPGPGYWFEYASTPLISALQAGHAYEVSFYVSLPGKFCPIQHIGAFFSNNAIDIPNFEYLQVTPQVESNMGWLSDTLNWMLITGCFVAQGGEQYITIGNFHSYANTIIQPCNAPITSTSYYYMDDVSVIEMPSDELDVDLGDEVTACYEYTIVPDAPPGVAYHWSDGSFGETLTVTTSGLYKLTVTSGCDIGKDSVMVEILGSDPVDFNPAEVTICQGEQFEINLDPNAGTYEWNDGSISSTYSITASGLYVVTLDDGCDLTTDEINVIFMDPPLPITLGNDTILCQGTNILFSLDPSLGEYTWQNGSTDPFFDVVQGGQYAVTLTNICGESSTTVLVDQLDPYEVNLGPDEETLCDNDFIDITLENEYATYIWQDGSDDSFYHISDPGIYSVTATHVCGESEDQIIITQLDAPDVYLGTDFHGCPGDVYTLTVEEGTASIIWQDGSTNDSLLITGPGIYSVAVENVCGIDHDTLIASYSDVISPPSLGPDLSLCPGEQITLHPGHQIANYHWQDGSTADTLVVNTTGLYAVTVSNDCYSFADTVEITVHSIAPVIDLPDQLVLCEGSSTTLDPMVNDVSFSWNDGSTDSTLFVSTAGTYSLTVSNSCGTDMDSVIILSGGAMPLLSLGADTSICAGASFLLQSHSINVDTWLWQDGSGSQDLMVSDSGYFFVHGSNDCGMASDTIHVALLESTPAFEIGNDTSVCAGQVVTLDILTPNVDIKWNDGSVDPTFTIQTPGMYSVTISNACGMNADTINVMELPDVPILSLGVDQPLCPGETIIIDPSIPNVDYTWQDGSTGPTFLADHDQTIILTISNSCGTSTDSLIIFTSTQGPDVDLGDDILACEGTVVTIHSNISGVSYVWQDGSANADFVATVSGTYYLDVSNSCGADVDTIDVDIHGLAPHVALPNDTTLCEGNSILLVANVDTETSIAWQDGRDTDQFLVTQEGLYTLHLSNRCGIADDSIQVNFKKAPTPFDLGPDQMLCNDETLQLSAPLTNDEIRWQDGSHDINYLVDHAGIYELTISNDCGELQDAVSIEYENNVVEWPEVDTLRICPGDAKTLDVTQNFEASYAWSDGSSSSGLHVTSPGTFTVTVSTSCFVTEKSFIVLAKTNCFTKHDIFIPNIFSPNGDNMNDVFVMDISDGVKVNAVQGTIFDRWGDVVFSSSEIPFSWNGSFRNQKVLPGVYVYVFDITYEVNAEVIHERMTGDVTVIR